MNSACFGSHHQYQEVLMGSIENKLPEFYFRLLEIDLILVFDIWKYNQSIMIFYFKEYCTKYWNIIYVSLCFKEITDCFLKYFIWIWAMHNEEVMNTYLKCSSDLKSMGAGHIFEQIYYLMIPILLWSTFHGIRQSVTEKEE